MTDQEFHKLVTPHYRYMLNFARKRLEYKDKELAKDLVQDTYMNLWKRRKKLDPNNFSISYIITSLKNNQINHYRKVVGPNFVYGGVSILNPQECSKDYSGLAIELLDKDNYVEQPELDLTQFVELCFKRLPRRFQLLLDMRHFDGMKYEEIANELSIPLGTVKSYIHKGRVMLQDMLREYAKENYNIS